MARASTLDARGRVRTPTRVVLGSQIVSAGFFFWAFALDGHVVALIAAVFASVAAAA